jgi:hypothetical protein
VVGSTIEFVVSDKHMRIEVKGVRTEGVDPMASAFGEMSTKIQETLIPRITIRVIRDGNSIFEGTGDKAVLEFVGDIDRLLAPS